ncbi:MAG: hypothetical protein OXF44_13550 [Anaerolineaceae bacterium]|nr:hypothetical protein [Anaerolineaceae bacterium]
MTTRRLARSLWPLLVIVLLALGYRLLIMADRAAASPAVAAWDPLPGGSDQKVYLERLQALQSGDYPPGRFHYQPGFIYFLGLVSAITGSDDLHSLRLVLVVIASLNCGLMAGITWLATKRRGAGLAAGLLLAFYPPGAFYDTDFVITSQSLVLATLMTGAAWLAWRRPRTLVWPALTGLTLGAGAVTRFELVGPGVASACWLFVNQGLRRAWRQVLVLALAALLLIAPVALHNRQGGADYLISAAGPREMYRGNNRDADGLRSPSNASATTHDDYLHWLLQDIALEPVRFGQLILHKAAFFLSSLEAGNNLNFAISGQAVSPWLARNPLNFSVLLALTMAGLVMLWRAGQRPLALLLLTGAVTYLLMVLLLWVESRIKTPVIAWMLPAAGFAIDRGLATLRQGSLGTGLQRNWRLLLAIAAVLLLIEAGVRELPRDVTLAELPGEATAANLIYDDRLELVGWQVREQYSPRNSIRPFHPWVVSLYWRLTQASEVDYSFSLKYFIGERAVITYDRPLGYVAFPRDYSSDWQVGPLYVEHIGLSYRKFHGPLEQTGRIVLDVYPESDPEAGFDPYDNDGARQGRPVLARPAILLPPGSAEVSQGDREVAFGDALHLLGADLPTRAAPGERVALRSAWRSGAQQIEAPYAIGVFLFREGEFIGNVDSPPAGGALQTFSLLPGYHFDDEKWLDLPPEAGLYEVFIAVYDQRSMARLPVAGAADDLHFIGSIEVF